jgi:serine/threonine protein kinase
MGKDPGFIRALAEATGMSGPPCHDTPMIRPEPRDDANVHNEGSETGPVVVSRNNSDNASVSLGPGSTIAGYRIERLLGAGGMGSVYLAVHPRLPRRVAIKLLRPELCADPRFVQRFHRESTTVAQLEHPNILPVLDRGSELGQLWMSMPYIAGIDADKALQENANGMEPNRAVHIIGRVASALDYAHRQQLLHRDVKPANILLAVDADEGEQERVFLTDFGIAKSTEQVTRLTETGAVIATFDYASPEQIEGRGMDHRSDIYSLGCVLYQLLTGSVPYPGSSVAVPIHGHLHVPPPRPSQQNLGLPPALDAVIAKAMAKNPDERYDSCRALWQAASHALAEPPGPTPGPSRDSDSQLRDEKRSSTTILESAPPRDAPPHRAAAPPVSADHVITEPEPTTEAVENTDVVHQDGRGHAKSLTAPLHDLPAVASSTPTPDSADPENSTPTPTDPASRGRRIAPLLVGVTIVIVIVLAMTALVLARRPQSAATPSTTSVELSTVTSTAPPRSSSSASISSTAPSATAPSTPATPSLTTTSVTAVTPTAVTLNAAQQDLLDQLPEPVRASCRPPNSTSSTLACSFGGGEIDFEVFADEKIAERDVFPSGESIEEEGGSPCNRQPGLLEPTIYARYVAGGNTGVAACRFERVTPGFSGFYAIDSWAEGTRFTASVTGPPPRTWSDAVSVWQQFAALE